jgi:hypothetical protein
MILSDSHITEWWFPAAGRCFYCGDALDAPPWVAWRGADAWIILHRRCAPRLATHLIGDTREADLASGEPPWDTRATNTAVAALERRAR